MYMMIPSWAAASIDSTITYTGWTQFTDTCGSVHSIQIKEPETSEKYPLFIYLVGTGGMYNGREASQFLDNMVKRGFVSASVEYPTLSGLGSETQQTKSKCIFDSTRETSAVSKLCTLPKVDCSKGIVTAGLSQGAYLAVLANNYDSRVRATYALGFNESVITPEFFDPTKPGIRTLPADRLRIVNGGNTSSNNLDPVRTQVNTLTNLNCNTNAHLCFAANGSGWYFVQNNEVQDGIADHCYFHGVGGCSNNPPFDIGWLPPSTFPWSLETNLNWLASFTTNAPTSTISPTQTGNPSATTSINEGDANGDGKVDGVDYLIWLTHYNQTVQNGRTNGDFNNDTKVDGIDFVLWLINYTSN